LAYVAYWPLADIEIALKDVCFGGASIEVDEATVLHWRDQNIRAFVIDAAPFPKCIGVPDVLSLMTAIVLAARNRVGGNHGI
jgi:hypothetical protein